MLIYLETIARMMAIFARQNVNSITLFIIIDLTIFDLWIWGETYKRVLKHFILIHIPPI